MQHVNQSVQSIIHALESAFHIKLSPEQKQIILYGHKTPVIVIACAGSGKTTVVMVNTLFTIMTGQVNPDNILGITFSKKAQLNMLHKYMRAKKILIANGWSIASKYPLFSTFDALFFHLIKSFPKYKNVRVLSNYLSLSYPLLHALTIKPKDVSAKSELQNIFELRSQLIDDYTTFDGYHFQKYDSSPNGLKSLLTSLHMSMSDGFIVNYLHVVHKYLKLKADLHLIDFLDMKVLLLKLLTKKANQKHIQAIMSQYHLCFIDEFQDIDNLEWNLMQKILPKATLNSLTVIGDDDQSIYSFRGSNPKIILNFKNIMKNAVRFNLSTNYRTNGHVLDTVRPLIENNKYRMKKQLKASHSVPGGVYAFMDNKYASGGELLLHKVWKMYLSPDISNSDIVILVRYNLDKMIATDWFANHNLYLNSNHLLQKNYVYKAITAIINSIYFDDLHSLMPWLQVLDFKQYKRHINNVKAVYYPRINSLSLFICNILKYDKNKHLLTSSSNISNHLIKLSHHSKKAKKIVKILQTDLQLYHAWNIREDKQASGSNIFKVAKSLVSTYFHFMVSHHYMSKNVVNTIERYLHKEMIHYNDVGEFLEHEWKKASMFGKLNTNNQGISILTIHQSKGLQFKYVFLYNLSNLDVTTRYQHINWIFGPQLRRSQFLAILRKLSKQQLNYLDDDKSSMSYKKLLNRFKSRKQNLIDYYKKGSLKQKYNYKQAVRVEYRDELQRIIANKFVQTPRQKVLQNKFNSLYNYTISISSSVEEERRLIYVGFTRAENSAVFNYNSDSNPLLNELNINKQHIMVSNSNKVIVPIAFNKAGQIKEVDKQIQILKQRRNKLMKK